MMENVTFIKAIVSFMCMLILVGAEVNICSTYCLCKNTVVSCKDGYVLDHDALHLMPNNLTSITIENFVIKHLSGQRFQRFASLKQLVITNSRLRKIDEPSFHRLSLLEEIDLSNNHISELPVKLFLSQKNLTELFLSHNLLETLPEKLFESNPHLHTLEIRHNLLRLIPPKIFEGLPNLQHLDLSHNEISYILPRTFSDISVVRYIDLSNNLLVTLHEDLFASNNMSVETRLSVIANPLDCNCGLVWLRDAVKGTFAHLELLNATHVVCANPRKFHDRKLRDIPLEHLNCTPPTAIVVDKSKNHIHKSQVKLNCSTTGSPHPSIVWKTPLFDYLSDPHMGEWLDGSVPPTFGEKKYRIYATGEVVHFIVQSSPGYSILTVNSLHLVSSGTFQCLAMNPGGNVSAEFNIDMVSSIEPFFIPSLMFGGCAVLITICIGVVGCTTTACIDKCSCCKSMNITYYDGSWMNCGSKESVNNNNADKSAEDDCSVVDDEVSSSDDEFQEDDELLGAAAGVAEACPIEITENTPLTAEVWDAYFREYPDDFIVESFDTTSKKSGSPTLGVRCSTHPLHGKTLETLEGVRVRLKLRGEQLEVMKERLRIQMGKHSARMRDTMEKRKERMNKKMQTIKDTTSQSLQTIRETGRNYSHKLHMGVRTAMENVGAQVLSLKEFCGTGDLGQTMSIATITTDIDTNEISEVSRNVTMV
ncbi:leucine-rich repeat and fibronectin type-III domain-containing protein 4-like [Watersipora subatra]|uniref:leucine-rich repeat and fibronectin type-III domain-containing protein 4-like n=1 Tax=Watersipora subatra TaxID=2589382 RepID=UPI00355B6511